MMSTAGAKQRPVWEIGVGAFGTYQPAYYGSEEDNFGGFPVVYFSYRGEDFSILSNGLYDVAADDENVFDFGLSVDLTGDVDSDERLYFGDIDTVIEAGPKLTFALYADGESRLEASLAARVAYEWGEDYIGWVLQPEVAFLTTIDANTRMGIFVSPKFGFDGYNERFYSTYSTLEYGPAFYADDGYIGTDIGLRLVSDVTDQFRISGEIRAISLSGAENEESPLYQEDWNFAARIGFTYSLWQSDEMTDS